MRGSLSGIFPEHGFSWPDSLKGLWELGLGQESVRFLTEFSEQMLRFLGGAMAVKPYLFCKKTFSLSIL